MGTHLAGFVKSITSITLVNLTAIQDDVLTNPATDRFFVPPDYTSIHALAAVGVDVQRGTIDSPSLETKRASPEILPHENGAAKFTLAAPKVYFPKAPLNLVASEALTFPAANNAVGANKVYGLLWLKKAGDLPPVPSGDIIIARATGTTTVTADAWTSCAVTLDKDLPAGQYALVHFVPMGVSVLAARALIPGQQIRPGMIGFQGAAENASRAYAPQIPERLGYYDMGHFSNTVIPQFQFLCTAADTAQTVILYLVKIG